MAIATVQLFVSFILLYTNVHSFNFEYRNPLVKRGETGTYFGYSVAEHKSDDSGNLNHSWLLVGAPLGQNLQPNTNRSGALFKCPVVNYGDCVQIETDGRRLAGGRYLSNYDYDEDESEPYKLQAPGRDEIKNGQWLGVNVRSQGIGGKVMVCAHRYITSPNLQTAQHGIGLCYSLNRNLDWDAAYLPCKGKPKANEHQQYGFCQVGTSLALLDDGTAIIGSPGPFTWRGTMFVLSIVGNILSRDNAVYSGPLNDKPEPIDKYSYLGMSVAAGKFLSKSNVSYAGGAPRSQHHGQVYIFNKLTTDTTMNVSLIINGEQFASNFGYEIISTDINKDGYDDLVVAAPYYFNRTHGGAVYIYYDLRSCTIYECHNQTLYGPLESRFGFSMTSLGDINKDGYVDIAVGAPYEGGGAIYIYLGSKDGLNPIYSQKIHPEAEGVTTIGYSLSGGLDMDNNGYPDLLTGAYESDMVILFKTRPIIDIKIHIEGKELKNVNTSRSGCMSDSKTNNTCFSFQSCFTISSAEAKTLLKDVVVRSYIESELFDNKKFSRVWFKKKFTDQIHAFTSRHITLTDNQRTYCHNETVYIKEGTRDILTPIKFRVNYTLADNEINQPILNQTSVKIFQATFQKDCGADDTCQTNLILTATLPQLKKMKDNENKYLLNLGNVDEITLQVNVINKGESAYEAELFIAHPESLSYIALNDKLSNIKCTTKNDTMIICSLGNPLPSFKNITLGLRFENKDIINKESQLHFNVSVNSTSEELSTQTSAYLVAIIKKKAEVHIYGSATQHVVYGGDIKGESAMEYFDDIGKRVWHKYHVGNEGPWHVQDLQVNIFWPWQVANDKPQGKWLLYLEETPQIDGGFCRVDPSNAINLLNLTERLDSMDPDTGLMPPNNLMRFNASNSFSSPLIRRRRDTELVIKSEQVTGPDGKKRSVVYMDCSKETAKCVQIICTIKKLGKGDQSTVIVKSRIWNSTLVEDYNNVDWVSIWSRASITLSAKDHDIEQNTADDKAHAFTDAYPEIGAQEDAGISIWVYIGAALAGLLLLILIIFILWKIGFFKRKRVNDPTLTGNLVKAKDENETLLQ